MKQNVEKYLEQLRLQDKSDKTIQNYELDLLSFIRWFGATHGQPPTMISVTPLDIREYRTELVKVRQMKPSTVNRHLATLRGFFNWGRDIGLLVTSPTEGIRGLRQAKRAPKWLTRQQTYALLRATTEAIQLAQAKKLEFSVMLGWRNKAIVTLMLFAGLRVSEVCNLQVNDVTLQPRSGVVMVRFGKGRKYREVPLNKDARLALKYWLAARPLLAVQAKPSALGFMFIGKKGGQLHSRGVQRLLNKLGQMARLSIEVTPHMLRHTFGKNLVDQAVPLDRVSLLLGHDSLDTTAIYTTPSQQDLQEAVESIAWQD